MAAFNKFQVFVQNLANGAHNLATDTIKVALTNTAPTATDTTWNTTSHPAPAAAAGYTAGGNTLTTTSSTQTGGVEKAIYADTIFTAAAGQIGPFRYAVVYDFTAAAKPIGYYDYGASTTLNDTETFTVDLDNVNGLLQIT